jgi:hypothetical protein
MTMTDDADAPTTGIGRFAPGDRVTVDGWRGIAFYVDRAETERVWPESEWLCFHHDDDTSACDDACEGWWPNPDYDECEDVPTGNLVVVMVGDDREHIVDPDDCTALDDDAYCHECGQIGCTMDGRDRD